MYLSINEISHLKAVTICHLRNSICSRFVGVFNPSSHVPDICKQFIALFKATGRHEDVRQ